MTQHAFGERERLIVAATDGVAGAPPQVSVIVCADPDSTGLAACLASLADQSLDASRFETVLVWRGSLATEADPGPTRAAGVRLLTASRGSLAEARTIGLGAARGTHCLFVDPDDAVAPGLLEWLVAQSGPGVVPTAHFRGGQDAGVGSQGDARTARLLSRATGKLVESELARRVRFDERLAHGADAAYWLNLWTQERLELRVAGERDGADYTLSGPEPASPESALEGSLGIIEDLRGLRPTTPRARKMRDLMVDHAAEGIRQVLLEHPDLHETVVEEVRRRRIPRMPWPVVNRGRATQLAVLFGYPPFLDPSSIVAAKRLTQLGRITDVVSQDISTLRKQDPGATRIASEYVDRSVMLPGPATLQRLGLGAGLRRGRPRPDLGARGGLRRVRVDVQPRSRSPLALRRGPGEAALTRAALGRRVLGPACCATPTGDGVRNRWRTTGSGVGWRELSRPRATTCRRATGPSSGPS